MTIVSLLDKNSIFLNKEADNKEQLLEDMIQSLGNRVTSEELENIQTAVFEREAIMSTGVGKGLAIPHGKVKNLEQTLAAFAILKEPIDYKAIDDIPVKMVFMMVAPEAQNSIHIKLLSRISRMLNNQDFRDRLEQADDKDQIFEVFQEEESTHFGVE